MLLIYKLAVVRYFSAVKNDKHKMESCFHNGNVNCFPFICEIEVCGLTPTFKWHLQKFRTSHKRRKIKNSIYQFYNLNTNVPDHLEKKNAVWNWIFSSSSIPPVFCILESTLVT